MRTFIAAAFIAFGFASGPAFAETIRFSPGLEEWTKVKFPGIAPVDFSASSDGRLTIAADSAAGMLWRSLPVPPNAPRSARWRWRVEQGVAATDLTRRGGDDRAIAIYFVFSERPEGSYSPMQVLASSAVTTLAYVFGGDQPRDSIVASPHMGKRGRFLTLRPADAPKKVWLEEKVDLSSDYRRAFGQPMPTLVGIAISSDSDDTKARNRAGVQDLNIDEAPR